MEPKTQPQIGIVVVAFNAASTLAGVLDRIPSDFRRRVREVIVSDDSSTDSTYLVGLGYKHLRTDLPLTVVRNERNLGYGGNQKECYRLAMEHDLDIVVLLHGDGQYAPELLPDMVAPIEQGDCDVVLGSRMLAPGGARKGGMPLYKYVGNRVLTKVENAALGTDLSEFHSGYRAYRVDALRRLQLQSYSNDFDFDTQIIIGLVDHGVRIREIPIPTYYGDEICYVNGLRYARQVVAAVLRHRFEEILGKTHHSQQSLGSKANHACSPAQSFDPGLPDRYVFKEHPATSHGRVLARFADSPPLRVLDIGCGAGYLAERLRQQGHHVTGIDQRLSAGVTSRTDRFLHWDLGHELPGEIGGPYDVIILADVLEHLAEPEMLLRRLQDLAHPRTLVVLTVPNFSHWYVRARVALGIFDYDDRGILDRGHLRFFTRRTLRRLLAETGWGVEREEAIGLPWELLLPKQISVAGRLRLLEGIGLVTRPTLFSYQLLVEATSRATVAQGTPSPSGVVAAGPRVQDLTYLNGEAPLGRVVG